MHIELNPTSQAKLEDILDQLYTRYDLQELTWEELIDALLELGVDLVVAEEAVMPLAKARLIDYCARKVESRA